jgi:hypothetical protein
MGFPKSARTVLTIPCQVVNNPINSGESPHSVPLPFDGCWRIIKIVGTIISMTLARHLFLAAKGE